MSYTYANLKYPAPRKGAFTSASWVGTNDDLVLIVGMNDFLGNAVTVNFPCRVSGESGVICLPGSADVTQLPDNAFVASLRMSTLISDALVGSTEWSDALLSGETANMQTAIGVCKVVAVRFVSPDPQIYMEIDVRKNGTSNPTKTLSVTRDQFPSRGAYAAAANPEVMILPDFQALCAVPGEIEKVYASYVHDAENSQYLTQAQKDNIAALVLSMDPWI